MGSGAGTRRERSVKRRGIFLFFSMDLIRRYGAFRPKRRGILQLKRINKLEAVYLYNIDLLAYRWPSTKLVTNGRGIALGNRKTLDMRNSYSKYSRVISFRSAVYTVEFISIGRRYGWIGVSLE